jgi:adenylosuccinate synthase
MVKDLVSEIEKQTGVEVTLINTGKQWSNMVSKHDDLPPIDQALMDRLASYV